MKGLFQYDKNLNLLPTNIKGIGNNDGQPTIWSMYPSRDSNTIWMSGQPGIHAIDQANRSSKFYNPPQLENRTVRQIAEDRLGNLWLGMHKFGVFKWTATKGKKKFNEGVSRISSIPLANINCIVTDQKGLVWIGTASNGAYVIDPVTDSIISHFHQYAMNEKKLPEEGDFINFRI